MFTMKKLLTTSLLAASLSTLGLVGCTSTTGAGAVGVDRQQLLLVSNEEVLQMSAKSYDAVLQKARQGRVLDTNQAQLSRLKGIANRLIGQVGVYRPDAAKWNWEVHVVKTDQLNASVLPGGKILFYSGIIDRLNLTDDEIAAIMGHEISHALREHSRERISREYATQTGIGIAASVFGLSQGQAQLAGVAGDLGLSRPHSRTQESEADQIGLELMARAGYNPQAAITLWQKMQRASQGEPPQFLSTHPTSSTRISQMQALMPKVVPLYQKSRR